MTRKTSQEIVKNFINSNYKHMQNIPGNKVFVTDKTSSTLVWVEQNVVIEYYLMYPTEDFPMHSHPFDNQVIFIAGQFTGYRQQKGNPASRSSNTLKAPEHVNFLTPITPIGYEHGFKTGPEGAIIYNIQIWPEDVITPTSASIEYFGEPLGPMHQEILNLSK